MGQNQWALARPHLPLISHHIQRKTLQLCIRSAMLHASETWAPTLSNFHHLQRSDPTMILWMCSVTTKYKVSSQDLLERMQFDDLAKVLHLPTQMARSCRTWQWMGEVQKLNLTGGCGHGHPKKTWIKVIGMDCVAMGLTETHPSDRKARSGRLRSVSDLTHPILGAN